MIENKYTCYGPTGEPILQRDVQGEFQVNLGYWEGEVVASDVTKGVRISEQRNSDTTIGFLTPKNLPMQIFRSNQSLYRIFLDFCEFRALLEVKSEFVTSQRGSKCTYFEISDFLDVFVTQKLTKLEFEAEMLTTQWYIRYWDIGHNGRIWPNTPFSQNPRRLFVAPLSDEKNGFSLKLTYIGTEKSPETQVCNFVHQLLTLHLV